MIRLCRTDDLQRIYEVINEAAIPFALSPSKGRPKPETPIDPMSFYVYVLRCADGPYYLGYPDDLEARIAAHHGGEIEGYRAPAGPCSSYSRRNSPPETKRSPVRDRSRAGPDQRKKR